MKKTTVLTITVVALPDNSSPLEQMMAQNRANLRATGIWEFTKRKWVRQIDEEGTREFIKNSKHGSLSNFMVKGKQVEFSIMTVAKIL